MWKKGIFLFCVISFIFAEETEKALYPPEIFTYDQIKQGAFAFYCIGILYMFLCLQFVCDSYFVPVLETIQKKFRIREDVAGATFMAVGGSAPELFTNLIGIFIVKSTDVGFGTIVGSAVFNVVFAVGACALFARSVIQLTWWPLLRDTIWYAGAIILLATFYYDNVIKWWESLSLLGYYVSYVTFMKYNKTIEKNFKLGLGLQWEDSSIISARKLEESQMTELNTSQQKLLKENQKAEEDPNVEIKVKEVFNNSKSHDQSQEEDSDYAPWSLPGGFCSNLWYILCAPAQHLFYYTIPNCNKEEWKKYWPLAFIICITWIGVLTYLLVWWTTSTGRAFGIPDVIMGLTLLAVGNSIPDMLSSIAVTREGRGNMAISCCLGSNVFDITLGLPMPWLIWSLINGASDINVESESLKVSIATLFIVLMLLLLTFCLFRWRLTKVLGVLMMILYCGFLVESLVVEYHLY